MALYHLTGPKHRYVSTPSLIHLFSTTPHDSSPPPSSAATGDDKNNDTINISSNEHRQKPSFSSLFSDVKANLKHQPQTPKASTNPQNHSVFSKSINNISGTHNKFAGWDEIKKNLSEFRFRTAVPDPTQQPPQSDAGARQAVSFRDMHRRSVLGRDNEGVGGPGAGAGGLGLSFEVIRENLRHLKRNNESNSITQSRETLSMNVFKNSLKLQPQQQQQQPISGGVSGGTSETQLEFWKGKKGKKSESESEKRTKLIKMYTHSELGRKLCQLRPDESKEGNAEWFSLEELNERLAKLREQEVVENEAMIGGVIVDIRESLVTMHKAEEEKNMNTAFLKAEVLSHFGGTPNFMKYPQKEHLVEKYFHPDNMSSAEKMKLELKKVRDEFKMSESDCGSARVQVAQLTTKIHHLAKVLHKKDKHSRKGLVAMVTKRKKLLKYLRRTDWDSYCLVLSKLGLRDNPDYKQST